MVGTSTLLASELSKPVIRPLDVSISVHLEHVAELPIDEEASDREVGPILHAQELVRIASLHQLADRRLDALAIHLGLPIDRQGVIHVEPDRFDLVESQ